MEFRQLRTTLKSLGVVYATTGSRRPCDVTMLKLPFLHHEQEQSYNVHGIQYLKQKAQEGRATADSDASRFKYLRPASRHKRVTSPKAAAQSSSCVYPKNDALYVSTDWTENLFDKVSLADVDWMDSSCYPYENLVLSGGGAKGYAFIGALKVGVATDGCLWGCYCATWIQRMYSI